MVSADCLVPSPSGRRRLLMSLLLDLGRAGAARAPRSRWRESSPRPRPRGRGARASTASFSVDEPEGAGALSELLSSRSNRPNLRSFLVRNATGYPDPARQVNRTCLETTPLGSPSWPASSRRSPLVSALILASCGGYGSDSKSDTTTGEVRGRRLGQGRPGAPGGQAQTLEPREDRAGAKAGHPGPHRQPEGGLPEGQGRLPVPGVGGSRADTAWHAQPGACRPSLFEEGFRAAAQGAGFAGCVAGFR